MVWRVGKLGFLTPCPIFCQSIVGLSLTLICKHSPYGLVCVLLFSKTDNSTKSSEEPFSLTSVTQPINEKKVYPSKHLKNLLSLLLPHSMTIPWKQLPHQNLSISPTQKCKRNSFKTKSLPPFFFLLPSSFNSLFIFPLLFQGNCMGFWSDSYPHPYLSKVWVLSHLFNSTLSKS